MGASYELTATVREKVGKGAARAVRRQGLVPAVIYGGKQPPISINLPDHDVYFKIHGGGFFTTVATIDVAGEKIRAIPRDYQLDPVSDRPLHVDFLRVVEGSRLTVDVPVQFVNEGAVARHQARRRAQHRPPRFRVDCPADTIPEQILVDLTGLDISDSLHISAVTLPEGVRPTISERDFTIATIAAPAGVKEEMKAQAEAAAAAKAAAAAAAEAGTDVVAAEGGEAKPAAGAAKPLVAAPSRKAARSSRPPPEAAMLLIVGLGNPGAEYATNGTMSASWPSMRSTAATASAPWRRRFHAAVAEGTLAGEKVLLLKPQTYMNESGRAVGDAARFYKLEPADIIVDSRRDRPGARQGAHEGRRRQPPATTASARSTPPSATTIGACASASAIPASRSWCRTTCCTISPRPTGPGSSRCSTRSPTTRALLAEGKDSDLRQPPAWCWRRRRRTSPRPEPDRPRRDGAGNDGRSRIRRARSADPLPRSEGPAGPRTETACSAAGLARAPIGRTSERRIRLHASRPEFLELSWDSNAASSACRMSASRPCSTR